MLINSFSFTLTFDEPKYSKPLLELLASSPELFYDSLEFSTLPETENFGVVNNFKYNKLP